ncbi:unnamed protein product [Boreogadus saida]
MKSGSKEPYLAQFRLAQWHNSWGAEELLVNLALGVGGDSSTGGCPFWTRRSSEGLQAMIRALERWFGQPADRRRQKKKESLGVYAAEVLLYTRRGYQDYPPRLHGLL